METVINTMPQSVDMGEQVKRYSKHLGLFRNKKVKAEIICLDPVKDHCRIVQLMTAYEFPWDIIRSMEIALMSTFCSPSISGLLHRTGEYRNHGQKRYDDTALLMAEFMEYGYDSDRGRRAIAHMNKMHALYKIPNDDYLFVLATFVLHPIQWIDEFGWRKITDNESQAIFYFFKEVGERMDLQNIPVSLIDLQKFFDEYVAKNFEFHNTNHALGNATVNILKGWLPFFAKPFVLPVLKCMLDDNMLKVLGYSPASSWLKALLRTGLKLRAISLRLITFNKYPFFVTEKHTRTYPNGYEIEQLGPKKLLKKL